MPLAREEYVEQAYFFKMLRERMQQSCSTQEILAAAKQEVLSTTQLPYALDFMATELRHTGGFATAMSRLDHYFTPFQAYIVSEAERAEGKFDFRIALELLEAEAEYRTKNPSPEGLFFFQFESLSRNRLGYDRGLEAIAKDEIYDEKFRNWILCVRRDVGLVDICDLIFLSSEEYRRRGGELDKPILFGQKEGKIAWANRGKDPLFLFAALQRHLGYPAVPRPKPEDTQKYLIPQLSYRIERLELRIKLLEEEQRGGINLNRFIAKPDEPDA